jgi:hypothetical protein
MASITTVCSRGVSRVHRAGFAAIMLGPPGVRFSLENPEQLGYREGGEDGRGGSRARRTVGASDGDVDDLVRRECDLTVANVPGQ